MKNTNNDNGILLYIIITVNGLMGRLNCCFCRLKCPLRIKLKRYYKITPDVVASEKRTSLCKIKG